MICTAAPGDWCSIVRTDCRDATTEGCAAPSPARDTAGAGEVGAGRRGAEVPYRVWAQAERGPGGDTRTRAHTVLTHGRQTRACPVTRTHLYTPSRPRRSDRQTRRDAAHRCLHSAAAPPPQVWRPLSTSTFPRVSRGQQVSPRAGDSWKAGPWPVPRASVGERAARVSLDPAVLPAGLQLWGAAGWARAGRLSARVVAIHLSAGHSVTPCLPTPTWLLRSPSTTAVIHPCQV